MELIINDELRSLIPPLTKNEYTLLEENILCDGCRDEIVIWNKPIEELKCGDENHAGLIILFGDEWVCENCGRVFDNEKIILDGHNRYEICKKHNLKFRVLSLDIKNIDEAKEWMIINQFARRNLSSYQRSLLALQLENIISEKAKQNQKRKPESVLPILAEQKINTRDEVSKIAGISHGTLDKVKKIEAQATDEIKGKLQRQEISINQAFNETNQNIKLQEQEVKTQFLKDKELLPLTGNFDVIVIDPPWQMEKIKRDVAPLQVGFDYPTMTIDEIKNYQLPAEENCHIFMWITHKHFPSGFDIFDTWKVKYVCCFVWHKNGGFQPFGLPQYNCEFALYGRIGTPLFIDLKNFNVCFNADRTGHSEKPEIFYETLRRVTVGRRVDIFNRRNIEGFEKWGNEV